MPRDQTDPCALEHGEEEAVEPHSQFSKLPLSFRRTRLEQVGTDLANKIRASEPLQQIRDMEAEAEH